MEFALLVFVVALIGVGLYIRNRRKHPKTGGGSGGRGGYDSVER